MKVLIVKPEAMCAFTYITRGFMNAFNDIGCQAEYWNGDVSYLEKFAPDLYIGCSGHRKEIPKPMRGNIKVAIHVNPYGLKPLEKLYNVDINESQDAINWIVKQEPNIVFGYGMFGNVDKADNEHWVLWKAKLGIDIVGIPTAGDVTTYYPDPDTSICKIAYLGGRWIYKSHNIDTWLLPVIKKYDVKVMGHGDWKGIKGYLGKLPESDSGRKFLSSAKVCPCICEPHTIKYGIDIPERFFKVSLCGSLPVLDNVYNFEKYYNFIATLAKDSFEYEMLIDRYANNEKFNEERKYLVNRIRQETLSRHTYHHRMRDLCKMLHFDNVVELFNQRIATFK